MNTTEQIAGQEREANDLRERGTQIGEKALRVSQLELETRQKLAAVEEQLGIAQLKTLMQQVRLEENRLTTWPASERPSAAPRTVSGV